MPESTEIDTNLPINAGLFLGIDVIWGRGFVFGGGVCVFKAVFLLQSGKFPKVFFTLKLPATFLDTLCLCQMEAPGKSLGRQRQETAKKRFLPSAALSG